LAAIAAESGKSDIVCLTLLFVTRLGKKLWRLRIIRLLHILVTSLGIVSLAIVVDTSMNHRGKGSIVDTVGQERIYKTRDTPQFGQLQSFTANKQTR
jgi:hypothetical protein